MNIMWIHIGVIGLIVFFGLIWWIRERIRRNAWMTLAAQHGLVYTRRTARGAPLPPFKLFKLGMAPHFRNVLLGALDDAQVMLSDYQYSTASHKSNAVYRQTVCILQAPEMNLPHCYLRRSRLGFDALGRLFGGQDINFDEDPAFSKTFVLQGESEDAVRAFFTPPVRAFFLDRASTRLEFEARGDRFMFHYGRLLKPRRLPDLLAEARAIRDALQSPAS
jgi:hypothetical protein